jgi:inosine-uridine nucleoside N-ribohydrolase
MKIIFDNDAANDDVIALVYLASHPDITIEGITIAATGEAHALSGARNTADVCYLLGKGNIPIAYGSEIPCDAHGKPFPDRIRNLVDNLLDGMNMPEHPNPIITNSAVELIKEILESSNEKITILATGPLTNIAEFVQKHSNLIKKIEKIVIMGGAVNVAGNIQDIDPDSTNTVAEWNIYADPKAAQIVFGSSIPITLVPLDTTNQVPMSLEFYNSLGRQLQPGLKLIFQLLKIIVDKLGMDLFLDDYYLWDPLAAMICCNPQIALMEEMPILQNLETAQTECVKKNTDGSSIITVATQIIEPKLILDKFINEIKKNLMDTQSKPSLTGIYQMPPEQIKKDSTLTTASTFTLI